MDIETGGTHLLVAFDMSTQYMATTVQFVTGRHTVCCILLEL